MSGVAPPSVDALTIEIDAIQAKYKPLIEELKKQGEDLSKKRPSDVGALVGVDLNAPMIEQKIILHIPEVTMKLETIKLHIPEIEMRLQRWVFHTPSVRMVYKEFPWGGGMHVPEAFMQEHEIKLHIPEVEMKLQVWKLHLPEVIMKDQQIIFHVPSITVENSREVIDEVDSDSQRLMKTGQSVGAKMQQEISALVTTFLSDTRKFIDGQFSPAIAYLEAQLQSAHESARQDIRSKLNTMKASKEQALVDIEREMREIQSVS